ncbi:hypothetical protein Tco_0083589 [Tanacetum coccineum]
MESNKSIHRSDEQKNLYKALDKDEEPSTGSNQGSKRRRAGKEPELTSPQKEKTSMTIGKSTEGSKSHHKSADKSAQAEEPMHTAKDLEEPAHQEFVTRDTEDKPNEETSQLLDCTLAQKEDTRESFNELVDTPLDFSSFVMNRLKVDTLTPELLASLTFELMKGSCKSLVELEYFFEEVYKATTDQLDWNNPEGQESAHDVYSKRRIVAITKLQIVEWHNYKHLDWITVRRDDDKMYTFKEGDFNRLRIQDIEDMLLLLVQGKLTNLTVEERLAFNNKDKKNRLMRIDELHKFYNGTLNDVRTALNDRLKGIQMKYLPQTIWTQSNRDKAGAMI